MRFTRHVKAVKSHPPKWSKGLLKIRLPGRLVNRVRCSIGREMVGNIGCH